MAKKQSRSVRDDEPAAVREVDSIETPEHHVETAEEVYRSAEAIAPEGFTPQRVYSLSAEAAYEAGARMARHPWATLAAGILIGCLAGAFMRSRR